MDLRLSREDFEEWRTSAATAKVFHMVERLAREAKHGWIARAWEGDLTQQTLYEHRGMALACQQLVEFNYEDYLAWAKEAGEQTESWNR